MLLRVLRNPNALATPGMMLLQGQSSVRQICYTLEPSQMNPEHPDIVPGIYDLVIAWSPHFKMNLPHILGVPGRLYIEIHPGNTVENTEGCTCVGESFNPATNTLQNSVKAFQFLMGILTATSSKWQIEFANQ